MEKYIREYETFIKKAAKNPTPELVTYHREMLANFQHERAIHLAVTLFFAGVTVMVLVFAALAFNQPAVNWVTALPLAVLAGALAVWTGFYIKHYFFLENHIQKLYEISDQLGRPDVR